MSAESTDHRSSIEHTTPVVPDQDFDSALNDFCRISRETLENILRERIAAVDKRLADLEEHMRSNEALVERATKAEAQITVLQQKLEAALAEAKKPDQDPHRNLSHLGAPSRTGIVARPPSRRPPEPRPEIPANPRLQDVIEFLARRGFRAENNRSQGGGVWVFANDEEFASALKELKSAGIGARYFPRGRKLRAAPQYEIDPFKVLPD